MKAGKYIDVSRTIASLSTRVRAIAAQLDLDVCACRLASGGLERGLDKNAEIDEQPIGLHPDRCGFMEAADQYSAEPADQLVHDARHILLWLYIAADAQNITVMHLVCLPTTDAKSFVKMGRPFPS